MKAWGITDVGKVRKENQDNFIIREYPESIVAVVCDGMGGARSGNVAAQLAASCFAEHIEGCRAEGDLISLPELVNEAACCSNVKVYDRAFTDFTCEGMGTTLVGGIFTDGCAYIANVGDSRAYLISEGEVHQITTDHSYVEELVQKGVLTREAAKNHPKRNYITRALGLGREVECDIYTPELQPGCVIILCSDGLANMVTEEEMLLASEKHTTPEELCTELMGLALSREATDNITVAAVLI